jgi:hypothetical protein
VTSLLSEFLRAPSSARESRALDGARERTVDTLAGRTVWCVGATTGPAGRLWESLQWASPDGVAAAGLAVLDDAEAPAAAGVRPDDNVVLHEAPGRDLAGAIRDRGAHAVWHVRSPLDQAAGIDAYLLTGRTAGGAFLVAAVMPSAGLVDVKAIPGGESVDLGWSSLLADVVRADRDECVGGTLHARPAIAIR